MTDLTREQALQQGLATLRRAAERTHLLGPAEPEYAIFLGNSPHPYDDDRFAKKGFARNSVYNKLSDMFHVGCFMPGTEEWRDCSEAQRREYWDLCQAVRYQHTDIKKALVDAAMAEGLIRIAPVTTTEETGGSLMS